MPGRDGRQAHAALADAWIKGDWSVLSGCLFNFDPAESRLFWLTTEYLPSFVELIPERYRTPGVWESELREAFGDLTLIPVPIPHDCLDGFYGAFWRRPAAFLDARVRSGISVFARLAADDVARGIERLGADLALSLIHI